METNILLETYCKNETQKRLIEEYINYLEKVYYFDYKCTHIDNINIILSGMISYNYSTVNAKVYIKSLIIGTKLYLDMDLFSIDDNHANNLNSRKIVQEI